ncbi:MAG: hypothetical protein DRQ47_04195 [Gammaproteobacteria bacterium]|nr:MAG: hypothetical protein DRQ47_04195 [Gammaproteobacteria bacterium]
MIILRKLGTQQGSYCRVILSDDLVGTVDGVNQVFTVSHDYVPGRIEIIYNGQVLTSPLDFEETGSNEITFVYLRPVAATVLKANYEIEGPGNFGTFLDLDDTPFSYAGHEGEYVRVNQAGDALEFLPAIGSTQEGVATIASGVSSTVVTFETPFDNSDYVLVTDLENAVDACPSLYPTIITAKTTTGFEVDFAGTIDSANYSLNWQATTSGGNMGGSGTISGSTYYTLDLVEDTTPELGGDLQVGSNAIMLDTTPSGNYIHGYVIGWSGEASEDMYVQKNDTGFGCPLYMRSDGKWFQCTAASGTTQMPCTALALDEGTGANKKIIWKGIVRKGAWSWTPGDMIYVSTVAGALTNTPTNSGAWEQPVGLAIKPDTIRFDPGFYPGYINS